MRLRSLMIVVASVVLLLSSRAIAQLGTTFTYQGRLETDGQPYTGTADFTFELWDFATGGNSLTAISVVGVQVNEGIFTTDLSFGVTDYFTGGPRFMAIQVRTPSGVGPYRALAGRQRIAPTPYAFYAGNANNAARATSSAAVDGIVRAANGNIGIGQNVPTAKLHVAHSSNIVQILQSSSAIGTWLQLLNTSTNGRNWNLISSGSGNGEGAGKLLINDQSAGGGLRMTIDTVGNVGIGTATPTEKLHVNGNIRANVIIIDGGADVAESYDIAKAGDLAPAPGMVVSIDPDRIGKLRVSTGAYDKAVAGIISGADGVAPGLVLGQKGTVADGEHPVANVGRVWCFVDADAGGAVTAGDLLTTSPTPGHAMKASDQSRTSGAVLGKAMSPLKSGKGKVLVLVSLQ